MLSEMVKPKEQTLQPLVARVQSKLAAELLLAGRWPVEAACYSKPGATISSVRLHHSNLAI